jgi:hypothetical protein
MVPRYIELVEVIPVSDIGKIRYDLLQQNGLTTWDASRDYGQRPRSESAKQR